MFGCNFATVVQSINQYIKNTEKMLSWIDNSAYFLFTISQEIILK